MCKCFRQQCLDACCFLWVMLHKDLFLLLWPAHTLMTPHPGCRRFQPVMVPEPSVDETYQILLGLRERYEAHHKLRYTDDSLDAAAKYSSQYISDRFLPDKAIDLIDEAGSRVRLRHAQLPEEAREFDKELKALLKEKDAAVRSACISCIALLCVFAACNSFFRLVYCATECSCLCIHLRRRCYPVVFFSCLCSFASGDFWCCAANCILLLFCPEDAWHKV